MIKINNLIKNYGTHQVLKGINLEVQKGEIYGFIGHNGAGKSTTMNIMSGLIKFQSGSCIINGTNVKSNHDKIHNKIGYLPENPRFYPYMNAWEYLNFIGKIGGNSRKEIKTKSEKLLEMVNLKKAAKRRIGGYSRGMKQRLGLAAILYHDPQLLLLDEPSSALDPEGRKEIIDIILQLKEQGKTVFLSTHILTDMERLCDRIGILHDGEIILERKLNALLKNYILPVYDIEFEEPLSKQLIKKINDESWIKEVYQTDEKLSIYIADMEIAKDHLIKTIAKLNIPVVSYNLRKSNLEDIFLRLVKEDE